jgi:hypothetical protein
VVSGERAVSDRIERKAGRYGFAPPGDPPRWDQLALFGQLREFTAESAESAELGTRAATVSATIGQAQPLIFSFFPLRSLRALRFDQLRFRDRRHDE